MMLAVARAESVDRKEASHISYSSGLVGSKALILTRAWLSCFGTLMLRLMVHRVRALWRQHRH